MDDSLEPPLRLPPKTSAGQPVWGAGGSVDACSVSLRFFGEDLAPDEITQLLEAFPTTAYRKGDIFRGKKYDRMQKTGSWQLSVEKCAGVELEDQINALLDRLPSDLHIWQRLTDRFEAALFCGLWLERCNRCLVFSPETMQRIEEKRLVLQFHLYANGLDMEEILA